MHGRVRAAASLGFVLAAQARKLPLLVCLAWAEEAQKRHARNSDSGAAIIEVLSYPLCFLSLRLVVVALGRSSWCQTGLATAMFFFLAPPPGYAVPRFVAVSAAVALVANCWGSRFIAAVVIIDNAHTAVTDLLEDVCPV